ncbi:hypothetical protein Hypma_003495 [Hypsizygus marmoreus]|uniref:Uncharacterized protein n=1 Tax=Hypsizygus marmoreus TaxID=39966 RepID=A0A369J970_HYPMA|nr:hypothetical protein Hypma_003495 [Hypsizygus marmoreus]
MTIRLQLISQIEEFLETTLDKWATIDAHLRAQLGFLRGLKHLDKYVSDLPEDLPEHNKLASTIDRTFRITADLGRNKRATRAFVKGYKNNPLDSVSESQHFV